MPATTDNRIDLLREVYNAVAQSVESFEHDDRVGPDLAYLLGALLNDTFCEWPEGRAIITILDRRQFGTPEGQARPDDASRTGAEVRACCRLAALLDVPLDATLGLPAGAFSYLLQDWAQRLCLKDANALAAGALQDLLGLRPGVRSLEPRSRAVAEPVAAFADSRPAPPPAEEGELLVLTADGKGVPMRRPAAAAGPRRHPRRHKGEKANKKPMACVGAVHDRPLRAHGRRRGQRGSGAGC